MLLSECIPVKLDNLGEPYKREKKPTLRVLQGIGLCKYNCQNVLLMYYMVKVK